MTIDEFKQVARQAAELGARTLRELDRILAASGISDGYKIANYVNACYVFGEWL